MVDGVGESLYRLCLGFVLWLEAKGPWLNSPQNLGNGALDLWVRAVFVFVALRAHKFSNKPGHSGAMITALAADPKPSARSQQRSSFTGPEP